MIEITKEYRLEDPKKINIDHQLEIDHWCARLRVTEEKLKKAVKAVGIYIDDIKGYLKYH